MTWTKSMALMLGAALITASACGGKVSNEGDGTSDAVSESDSTTIDVPGEFPFDIIDDCGALGDECGEDWECCSGRCYLGVCSTYTGTCEDPGTECVTGAECCSGSCEMEPDGVRRCQVSGGCNPAGEACDVAADCCSLYCVEEECSEDGTCAVTGEECTENYHCCSNICTDGTCEDSPLACQPLGEICGDDGNCCSENCVEFPDGTWRCASTYTCRTGGEVCTEDDDCCTLLCDDGYCLVLTNCTVVGEPCTGMRECCSGACADSGTGTTTCQYLSGCRSILELCTEADDCCSGVCEVDDLGLVLRCQRTGGCLDPGEVCWSGSAVNCCGGHELCQPTIAGVSRCYESDPGETCIPDGEACAFSDECCCELCVPDPTTGDLTCCPGDIDCVPEGGACMSDLDCCGYNCEDGICGPPDRSCVPLGGPCETDEDCCSNNCDPETHTCVSDLI